jgi:hypothetical protein
MTIPRRLPDRHGRLWARDASGELDHFANSKSNLDAGSTGAGGIGCNQNSMDTTRKLGLSKNPDQGIGRNSASVTRLETVIIAKRNDGKDGFGLSSKGALA